MTFAEWIAYQPPKVGGKPSFALTAPGSGQLPQENLAAAKAVHGRHQLAPKFPARLKSPAGRPLPGEGIWKVAGSVKGMPAVFKTYVRERACSSLTWASSRWTSGCSGSRCGRVPRTRATGNWGAPMSVPPGHRTGLVATFNSGFRIASSGGGFYLHGHYDGRS